ncbi:MAG: hypothetical protein JRG80_12345 [Deltaproteobacteria bacterium]|nr:hypothetical protein [Deltaproteobacteria bacterium]
MTNSLASSDVVAVHSGYAPFRIPLLRRGVELFESRSDARMAGPIRAGAARSRSSLHAKIFVVDRRRLFVGSFNWDPRSVAINTEMGIMVDSPVLARRVAELVMALLPSAAWRVGETGSGRLRWSRRVSGDACSPRYCVGSRFASSSSCRLRFTTWRGRGENRDPAFARAGRVDAEAHDGETVGRDCACVGESPASQLGGQRLEQQDAQTPQSLRLTPDECFVTAGGCGPTDHDRAVGRHAACDAMERTTRQITQPRHHATRPAGCLGLVGRTADPDDDAAVVRDTECCARIVASGKMAERFDRPAAPTHRFAALFAVALADHGARVVRDRERAAEERPAGQISESLHLALFPAKRLDTARGSAVPDHNRPIRRYADC